MSTGYVDALLDGARARCDAEGASLYVFPIRKVGRAAWKYDRQCRAAIACLTRKNFDGAIVVSSCQASVMRPAKFIDFFRENFRLPSVSIGFEIPGVHSIVADQAEGFRAIASHLVERHGRRRVAFLSAGETSFETEEREGAFRAALAEHGVGLEARMVLRGDYEYHSAFAALERCAEENGGIDFDAIVCANDEMACGCIDFLRKKNISVPGDVIVTGFDGCAFTSRFAPTITTASQRLEEQGALAVESLLKIIDGENVPILQKIPVVPMYRQSCGCVPMSDSLTDFVDGSGAAVAALKDSPPQISESWMFKRRELSRASDFLVEAFTADDMDSIRRALPRIMAGCGMESAVVCLYDEPAAVEPSAEFSPPSAARVFCAFSKSKNFFPNSEKAAERGSFDPREEFLPEEYAFDGEPCVVSPIFHRETQYGYIVCQCGAIDMAAREIFIKAISLFIATSFAAARKTQEAAELKERAELLDQISRADELTGLLNRRGFFALGQQAIDLALAMGQEGMALYADMDGLKKINDTYGHEAGDRAIVAAATLLKSVFRSSDVTGRLGGDEFCVVAAGLSDERFASIRERLDKKCEAWGRESGEKFALGMSVGSARFTSEKSSLAQVLGEADESLYKEKRLKKSRRSV